MKIRSALAGFSGLVVASLVAASMSMAHADVVYQVGLTINFSVPYTVSGTITTDGNSGTLAASDVLDYAITFSGPGMSETLNATNSQLSLSGSDLTAGSTSLTWNLYGHDSGSFTIADDLSAHQFALQFTSSSANFLTIGDASITEAGVSQGATWLMSTIDLDQLSIAAPPFPITIALGVPEPSTWAMMILGFCGLGYLRYRSSSKRMLADLTS